MANILIKTKPHLASSGIPPPPLLIDGELRDRLKVDGYLYLRGFFPRNEVLEVRKEILARMLELELVPPSSNPIAAIANPARSTVFLPELAKDNGLLESLIYSDRVMGFYQRLLGGPALHYDFTWFRPVSLQIDI